MTQALIFQPLLALILLTVIIAVYMLFTRYKAMKQLKIHPQKGQDTTYLKTLLPSEITRISNNYNHLFEQPVLFYVLCLTLFSLNAVDLQILICAWIYVALRILHSIIQVTKDIVLVRFFFFLMSWLPIGFMVAISIKHTLTF